MSGLEFDPTLEWLDAYQRNNKANGSKNLRCFPNHTLGGHQSGFCGRSIRVTHTYPKELDEGEIPLRCAIGMMCPTAVGNPLPKGKLFCLKTLTAGHLRSPKSPLAAMLPGTCVVDKPGHGVYEFNRELKGWHYGFVGSRRTKDILHTFRAYVFEETETKGVFQVIASTQSPSWKLYCRRRNQLKNAKANAEAKAARSPASSRASSPSSNASSNRSSPGMARLVERTSPLLVKLKRELTSATCSENLSAIMPAAKRLKQDSSAPPLPIAARLTPSPPRQTKAKVPILVKLKKSLGYPPYAAIRPQPSPTAS